MLVVFAYCFKDIKIIFFEDHHMQLILNENWNIMIKRTKRKTPVWIMKFWIITRIFYLLYLHDSFLNIESLSLNSRHNLLIEEILVTKYCSFVCQFSHHLVTCMSQWLIEKLVDDYQCFYFFFAFSVPTFMSLPEENLSKIADVLEEVSSLICCEICWFVFFDFYIKVNFRVVSS